MATEVQLPSHFFFPVVLCWKHPGPPPTCRIKSCFISRSAFSATQSLGDMPCTSSQRQEPRKGQRWPEDRNHHHLRYFFQCAPKMDHKETSTLTYQRRWDLQDGKWQVMRWEDELTTGDETSKKGSGRNIRRPRP